MSLSGRFVVYESLADDIAGGNPGTAANPICDIFLHDRDTDEDGVMDEASAIDTRLVSSNPCEQNLTNHSIDPSITYDGRFVVFATAAGNAKVDESCQNDDFNGLRDIFIFDRQIGSVTRRLSERGAGDLPGASGAPIISGNGNLLLFRTQAVNGGGASTPRLVVAAASPTTASRRPARSRRPRLPRHRRPTCRRRRRPAAPRIRPPAATARRPGRRLSPIPVPVAANRSSSSTRRPRTATARRSSPGCRRERDRPPAATSSTSRARILSTARRRCTGGWLRPA